MRFSSKFAGISVMACSVFLALAACGPSQNSSSRSATSSGKPAAGEPAYVPAMMRAMTQAMKDNAVPGDRHPGTVAERGLGDSAWHCRDRNGQTLGAERSLPDRQQHQDDDRTVILQLAQEGKLRSTTLWRSMSPACPTATRSRSPIYRDAQRPVQLYVRPKFNRTLDQNPQKAWTPAGAAPHRFFASGELRTRCRVRIQQHQHRTARTIIEQVTGMSASDALQEAHLRPLRPEADFASPPR